MGFTKIFNSIRSSTMLPSDIENVSLKRIIPKINEWNIDTVLISANRNCTACKQYNRQVFMGRIKIIQSYLIYYINVLALFVVKFLVLQYTAYNICDLHFKKLHQCNFPKITIYIIYFLFRILDKIFAYDIMSLISE